VKVLVTGSNGFVGKELIRSILSQGIHHPVSGVRKKDKAVAFDQIQTIELGDLEKAVDRTELLRDIDVIIHTAARVHVMKETSNNPSETYKKINVDATLNLANDAKNSGVKRFIFLSTIKVNGEESSGSSFKANDTPNPEGDYAISKHKAEEGLFKISKSSKMEVVIIRPPLIYGKGVKGNFDTLIKIVKFNVPLPFLRASQNKRSFVSINNLVDLLILCIDHRNAGNEIFLVSDGEDLSTATLIELIAKGLEIDILLFNCPPLLIRIALTLFGRSESYSRLFGNLCVSLEKNDTLLSWKPTEDVTSGIKSIFKETMPIE